MTINQHCELYIEVWRVMLPKGNGVQLINMDCVSEPKIPWAFFECFFFNTVLTMATVSFEINSSYRRRYEKFTLSLSLQTRTSPSLYYFWYINRKHEEPSIIKNLLHLYIYSNLFFVKVDVWACTMYCKWQYSQLSCLR